MVVVWVDVLLVGWVGLGWLSVKTNVDGCVIVDIWMIR